MPAWDFSNRAAPFTGLVQASGASWSGSNLTSITNEGSAGGSASASGSPPTKGATINGFESIRVDGATEHALLAMPALNTGALELWGCFKALSLGADQGLMNYLWASQLSGIVAYLENAGTTKPFSVGKGWDVLVNGYVANGPAIEAPNASMINDTTDVHIVCWQLGTTPKLFVDGVELTPARVKSGDAVPNYSAGNWELFNGNADNEPGNADFLMEAIHYGISSSDDRLKTEGLLRSKYLANLDPGHVYYTNPPTTGGATKSQSFIIF